MLQKPPLLIHINRGGCFKKTASVNLLMEAVADRFGKGMIKCHD